MSSACGRWRRRVRLYVAKSDLPLDYLTAVFLTGGLMSTSVCGTKALGDVEVAVGCNDGFENGSPRVDAGDVAGAQLRLGRGRRRSCGGVVMGS